MSRRQATAGFNDGYSETATDYFDLPRQSTGYSFGVGPLRWKCKECGGARRRSECLECGNKAPLTDEVFTSGLIR